MMNSPLRPSTSAAVLFAAMAIAPAYALPPIRLESTQGTISVSLAADGDSVPDENAYQEIDLGDVNLALDNPFVFQSVVTDVAFADGSAALDLIRVDAQDLLIFDSDTHGIAATNGSPFFGFSRQDVSASFGLQIPDHRRVRVTWNQLSEGIGGTAVVIRPAASGPPIIEEQTSSYLVPDENDGSAILNLPAGDYALLMFSTTQSLVPSFEGDVAIGTAEMRVELQSTPLPGSADVDEDGAVGLSDLLAVLSAWGCAGFACGAVDVDGDGIVGFADVLAVLTAWGD
jgi:hypothetical protein